jgi:Fe-S-cluster containining protein
VEVSQKDAYKISKKMLEDGDIEPYALRSMKKEIGRCVALKGKIGKDAQCSIYLSRPTICRIFLQGCTRCVELRKLHELWREDEEYGCGEKVEKK